MSEQTFTKLSTLLMQHSELSLAIVFGSVAQNTANFDSDLDIAILTDAPLDATAKMRWIEMLANATGRPIDLIDLATVGEPLLGQILRYGRRLCGSDTVYAGLLYQHVFNQADFVPYQKRILAERRRAWIGMSLNKN